MNYIHSIAQHQYCEHMILQKGFHYTNSQTLSQMAATIKTTTGMHTATFIIVCMLSSDMINLFYKLYKNHHVQ